LEKEVLEMPELGESRLPDRQVEMAGIRVRIGDEVQGRDGKKLGEVERVVVDARTDTITDLVVKHGFAFKTSRVVPLGCINASEAGVLRADIDEEEFETLSGFDPGNYRAPDPDYNGPPGLDRPGVNDLNMTTMVAFGPLHSGQGKPFGWPGGERKGPRPARLARPSVAEGTDILDCDGEKAGEVAAIEFEAAEGRPVRLRMRKGKIFGDEVDVPVDWVEDLSDKGVVLNVERGSVEGLGKGGY
jgi:sporulation protein YlmC with PRC-barrel domain